MFDEAEILARYRRMAAWVERERRRRGDTRPDQRWLRRARLVDEAVDGSYPMSGGVPRLADDVAGSLLDDAPEGVGRPWGEESWLDWEEWLRGDNTWSGATAVHEGDDGTWVSGYGLNEQTERIEAMVWYTQSGVTCPADLDGNGSVGVSDLLILLSNWG